MNSKDKGNIGEAIAIAEFTKRNIQVSIPFGDNARYDLVADFNGKDYHIVSDYTFKKFFGEENEQENDNNQDVKEELEPNINSTNKIDKKEYFCIDCGKVVAKQGGRCRSCAAKLQPRKIDNRPDREELKELIRNNSFVSIGKKYNVSDNAIRKWCDSYNLPRKVSEIKSYSEEDWSKI